MKERAVLVLALAVVTGCRGEPERPPEVRPDWSRFKVDGVAPLMTPAAVERELTQRGYRHIPCVLGEPIEPDAIYQSSDPTICYEDKRRNWRVSMYFINLNEGRRLAVIGFDDADFVRVEDEVSQARNAAFLPKLTARFGQPDHVQKITYTHRLWKVPGGSASLPDNIRTVNAPSEGRSLEMTSFWAYGQERPKAEPTPTPTPTSQP